MQKYTGIALGSGAVPIALAGGAAIAPVVSDAAASTLTQIAEVPIAQTALNFAKGLNPFSGEAPNPKTPSEAAGIIAPYLIKEFDKLGVWDKIGDQYNKNLKTRSDEHFNYDKNKILPSRTSVGNHRSKHHNKSSKI
ncbi:hypothetical protein [Desulfovibrio gilichinskyi]|uniref:Uncharacterized protein n=1 Tax=Desulfovibrio gilichinskyi TaxID=1519643 RepID=A0A1X7DXA9_9BACT|nr:hypothetical protein [Desulfovibrio gilichinskyi]SMF23524.1 hypothetical protein SAMN06295933_2330 [Desulfovibrio gilichinskyi]